MTATLKQGQELLKLATQSNISKEDLQKLMQSGLFSLLLRKFKSQTESADLDQKTEIDNFNDTYEISYKLLVDYTIPPETMINNLTSENQWITRKEFGDMRIKFTIPNLGNGRKKVVEVVFFAMMNVRTDLILSEYWRRGLMPDPYAVATVNKQDPKFACSHTNMTFWDDEKGNTNYMRTGETTMFGPTVTLGQDTNEEWRGQYWFGGVRITS